MLKTRCSALPLIAKCPAALQAPAVRIASADEEALIGTAVHACLRAEVLGQEWSARDVALAHGADADEVAQLAVAGAYCWRQLKEHFPRAEAEVSLYYGEPGVELTGHADVLALAMPFSPAFEVRLLDWKSGRVDADVTDQLKGYAFAACEMHAAETARACLVRLRDGTADWSATWTRDELRAWFAGFLERVKDRETFRPGAHCQYCPRFLECPAAGQLLRRADYDLIELEEAPESCTLPEPARLADMLALCRILERRCQLARDLARARVAQAGGRLDCGDGRALVLTEQRRREIDYAAGAEILAETFGADLADLLRVSKTEVEAAVRARAPRGRKGAAVSEFLAQLEHAGAMTTTRIERLEVRRSVLQLEIPVHGTDDPGAAIGSAPTDATGTA